MPCEDFSATLEATVGDYVARMTLVDVQDLPQTDSIASTEFTLTAGETEAVDVDFPADTLNGGGAKDGADGG